MITVVPTAVPKLQFLNANGDPLVGGLLFTYQGGTTTKTNTYTDSTGNTPNTNPIVLNALGQPPAAVFIPPQTFIKFVLSPPGDTDPPTNPIWTVDNISAAPENFGTIATQNANTVAITGGTATLSSLDVTGTATIGSLTALAGTVTCSNVTASGAVSAGSLSVSGVAVVSGNLTGSGNTALNTLNVTPGSTSLQTLTVVSDTHCDGNLFIATNNGLQLTSQTSDAGSQTATLTNAPNSGNPLFWLRITINGSNYAIPCWAA